MSTKLPSISGYIAKTTIDNDKKSSLRQFKGRSISEVEDPISNLQKNLFQKLDKYDKDENSKLNKSYCQNENELLMTKRGKNNKSLNSSFNMDQSQNKIQTNKILIGKQNLLEDDDMTDEQFLSDLYSNTQNIAKRKSSKILLGSTLSQTNFNSDKSYFYQTKHINPSVRIKHHNNTSFSGIEKPIQKRDELNSSQQNIQQENIQDVNSKLQLNNKIPFLNNILDQIDQNSCVIRNKNNQNKIMSHYNAITTPKKIISDSKTLSMNIQINNNIQNIEVINNLSDKKDDQKSQMKNKINQTIVKVNKTPIDEIKQQPKQKKLSFHTPFQNEVNKKELKQLDVQKEQANNIIKNKDIKDKKMKERKTSQKELPEYNENYTGIESFDESEDSDDNETYEQGQQLLQEYEELIQQSGAQDEYEVSDLLSKMKRDFNDLDKDLLSLKDIFQDMRVNWKEYEEVGADFGDIDQFIKEINVMEKDKISKK